VLLVDVPEELQLERLAGRDRVTAAQARASLGAQAMRAQRLEIADDVISNTGPVDELRSKVAALHRKYLALAETAG
jgi:dephospho-CoA kinase